MVRSSALKALLVGTLLLAPGAADAGALFDGSAATPGFQLFPFWTHVMADMAAALPPESQPVAAPSAPATPVAFNPPADSCADERRCIPRAWTDFLDGLKGRAPQAQLKAVNDWANARPYVEDIANWGVPDYWETPGEFIAKGGDCEDFAIAKYFSLVRLGFPAQDLRILVVSDTATHGFHAVLAARLDGMVWLLDNFTADVVPLESKPQYQPVYSLNAQGWWMHSTPSLQVAGLTITAAPLAAAQPVLLARN